MVHLPWKHVVRLAIVSAENQPCGHEGLSRILQPQVVGASAAAQRASNHIQQ